MKEFYQLTQCAENPKRFKTSRIIYNITPFLKLISIGLLLFSFSKKAGIRYAFMSLAALVFLSSCVLNYVRLKIVYEYRFTFDKNKGNFTVEKVYNRLKPKTAAVFCLKDCEFFKAEEKTAAEQTSNTGVEQADNTAAERANKIGAEKTAAEPLYFKENPFDYVLTADNGEKRYLITADTYMYALLMQEKQ